MILGKICVGFTVENTALYVFRKRASVGREHKDTLVSTSFFDFGAIVLSEKAPRGATVKHHKEVFYSALIAARGNTSQTREQVYSNAAGCLSGALLASAPLINQLLCARRILSKQIVQI